MTLAAETAAHLVENHPDNAAGKIAHRVINLLISYLSRENNAILPCTGAEKQMQLQEEKKVVLKAEEKRCG